MRSSHLAVAWLAFAVATGESDAQVAPDTDHAIRVTIQESEGAAYGVNLDALWEHNMTVVQQSQHAILASPVGAPEMTVRLMILSSRTATATQVMLSATIGRTATGTLHQGTGSLGGVTAVAVKQTDNRPHIEALAKRLRL